MKEGNGGRKQKMKTAEWIRTEREKRGMSRKELGDILGCTAEAVRLWEFGKGNQAKNMCLRWHGYFTWEGRRREKQHTTAAVRNYTQHVEWKGF